MIFGLFKPDSGKSKILVVDDSTTIQMILKRDLAGLGYEAVSALDGPQALKAAKSAKPALILLDITMPGMSGLEVLKRLKKDPETSPIPVIMCTSEQTGSDVETAFGAGAVGYLIKPYARDRLKKKIEEVCGGGEAKP